MVFRILQPKSTKYIWFLTHKYLILMRIKSYTSSSIVMHLSFVENSGLVSSNGRVLVCKFSLSHSFTWYVFVYIWFCVFLLCFIKIRLLFHRIPFLSMIPHDFHLQMESLYLMIILLWFVILFEINCDKFGFIFESRSSHV